MAGMLEHSTLRPQEGGFGLFSFGSRPRRGMCQHHASFAGSGFPPKPSPGKAEAPNGPLQEPDLPPWGPCESVAGMLVTSPLFVPEA